MALTRRECSGAHTARTRAAPPPRRRLAAAGDTGAATGEATREHGNSPRARTDPSGVNTTTAPRLSPSQGRRHADPYTYRERRGCAHPPPRPGAALYLTGMPQPPQHARLAAKTQVRRDRRAPSLRAGAGAAGPSDQPTAGRETTSSTRRRGAEAAPDVSDGDQAGPATPERPPPASQPRTPTTESGKRTAPTLTAQITAPGKTPKAQRDI